MFPAGGSACRSHTATNGVRRAFITTKAIHSPVRSYTKSIAPGTCHVQKSQTQTTVHLARYPSLLSKASSIRALHTTRPLSQRFSPLIPPPPSSLPKAQPAKQYKRTRKWLRRLFYLSVLVGGAHLTDRYFLYSSLTRSARTFALGIIVAAVSYTHLTLPTKRIV